MDALAARIEAYDPRLSADNRADELALHQEIVMATGIGSLTCDFDRTFVRSLDAAMLLVPEGYVWGLGNFDPDAEGQGADVCAAVVGKSPDENREPTSAATPALALCAAALRSRIKDVSILTRQTRD